MFAFTGWINKLQMYIILCRCLCDFIWINRCSVDFHYKTQMQMEGELLIPTAAISLVLMEIIQYMNKHKPSN